MGLIKSKDLLSGVSEMLSANDILLAGIQGLIAAEISIKRQAMGMSQIEFAKFMGVSQGMVSKWETGDCNFTLETLVAISQKLDIDMRSPFASKVQTSVVYPDKSNITPFPDHAKWKGSVFSTGKSAKDSEWECKEM